MMHPLDHSSRMLFIGSALFLTAASLIGLGCKWFVKTPRAKAKVDNLNARIFAWWIIVGIFGGALYLGLASTCLLFTLVSFMALREMITLAPTRRADHHMLFWAFFVIPPLQYYLIYIGWYGMFAVFIPVYSFIFLALRSACGGDCTGYMERTAKVFWALMICVYFVSHAPGLLLLELEGTAQPWKLLIFLVIVVQMSDVLQYTCGTLFGKHHIVPSVSPNKTWEGFVGGVLLAAALGVGLRFLTPFSALEAAGISLVIALLGFFGGLAMSAVKRDVGIKDFSNLIHGHGGMLDRIDSLTFSAPVFFHIVRWWFTKTV